MPTMIELCRMAVRVTTTAYDDQLNLLIDAAEKDLNIAGVDYDQADSLVKAAILTYVKVHWDDEAKNHDKLKADYDEQKAQMQTATGYTDWSR